MSLEKLPEALQQLVPKIEGLLESYFSDRSKTLPVKINSRNQNMTITWNIFPTAKIDLPDLFQMLAKTIDNDLIDINGEIIEFNLANGTIRDRGVQEFQILTGKTWEVYLYEPETFIYLRLLYESRTDDPDNKWISIDMDIVYDSAWFAHSE